MDLLHDGGLNWGVKYGRHYAIQGARYLPLEARAGRTRLFEKRDQSVPWSS
jgi:hypothetical protein